MACSFERYATAWLVAAVAAIHVLASAGCTSYVGGFTEPAREPADAATASEPDPAQAAASDREPPAFDGGLQQRDAERPSDPAPEQPMGASYRFQSIEARTRAILADVRSLGPNDRLRARYLDFTALANGGIRGEQLETYREALSFLLNSLSRGRNVVVPRALDESRLVYRVDLRDYGLSAESWRLLEQRYPYGVVYRQDSRLFQSDEPSSAQVRAETGTQIPVLQADWFIAHASRPPLYYQLLALPSTVAELEAELGIDLERNVASALVARAGFAISSSSPSNRVIERHERGGGGGALWRSYEFLNNLDRRNIFAFPLDFQPDGVEIMFQLDNGLSAYFVADAAGKRLDKVANELLRDPLARDGAAEAGISCMSCHQQEGPLRRDDEVLGLVQSTGSAGLLERVAGLYPPQSELAAAFAADQASYRAACSELSIERLEVGTLHALDEAHFGALDLATAASVLGLEASALGRALDASPQSFPLEIVALRAASGAVRRDAFDAAAGRVVQALGLGTPLRVP